MKLSHAAVFIAATTLGCANAGPEHASPTTIAAAQPAIAQPAAAPTGCKPPPTQLESRDIEVGKGDPVRFRAAVLVGYTGWLYDGCVKDLKGAQFDTSKGRRSPFGFIVGAGRVIKGWDEGLIGMKEGGRRLLVIPPDKGYGAKGAGGKIPPNATLVFEVELMKIIEQPRAQ